MLFVQKYYSLKEIDEEFVGALEELIQDDAPDFKWLIESEENAPEDMHFTYFLLFSPQKNAPIGLVSLRLKNLGEDSIFKKKLRGLFKVSMTQKELELQGTGVLHWGYLSTPEYQADVLKEVEKILRAYDERDDISLQKRVYIHGETPPQCKLMKTYLSPFCFYRESNSYEEYFNSLDKKTSASIKAAWKKLHEKKIMMKEYSSIKQLEKFSLSPKVLEKLAPYRNRPTYFISFEEGDKLHGVTAVIDGKNGNIFAAHIPTQSNDISPLIYFQSSLMKFLDDFENTKLFFMSQERVFLPEHKNEFEEQKIKTTLYDVAYFPKQKSSFKENYLSQQSFQ